MHFKCFLSFVGITYMVLLGIALVFLLMHYAAWKTGRPKLAQIFWYLWLTFSFIHMIVVYIMELAKEGGHPVDLLKSKVI